MKTHRNKIRPDGRLPSGGLPYHLMDALPLVRGDLQSRAERCRGAFCLDRDEARAGPMLCGTGPPGWRIRLPATGVYCRGPSAILLAESTLPIRGNRHPHAVLTAEGSDRYGINQILRPDGSGLIMTIHEWWSPSGRNGPVGTSPPKNLESHPERRRFLTSEGSDQMRFYQILRPEKSGLRMTGTLWWSPPGRNGLAGPSPPKPRNRHPDTESSAEGSDQLGISQILRPNELGLRMTHSLWWSPPGRNGPVGTSPPSGYKRARESIQQTYAYPPWWDAREKERHVGYRGSGPPKRGTRHPDAVLTAERSDQLWNGQIQWPDKSGPRMTYASRWKVNGNNKHSADEKQCSVLELCEGEKFSRSKRFGTPSFSLIANRTGDLFTINTFS